MADAQPPVVVEIDNEERAILAALKAVQEKKARILEEAEEKRKAEEAAEEKRKAKEVAETQRKAEKAEKKHKADEAEKEKAAQAQAEKEEAERIRAANEALKVGVAEHMAEVQRTADDAAAAQMKAQALATRQKKLAKLGVRPDDPLMLVPEGPGPSREEVRNIRQEVAGKGRKRKLRDTGTSVQFSRSFGVARANLADFRATALIVRSGA
jgi:colicin import membrane protein